MSAKRKAKDVRATFAKILENALMIFREIDFHYAFSFLIVNTFLAVSSDIAELALMWNNRH